MLCAIVSHRPLVCTSTVRVMDRLPSGDRNNARNVISDCVALQCSVDPARRQLVPLPLSGGESGFTIRSPSQQTTVTSSLLRPPSTYDLFLDPPLSLCCIKVSGNFGKVNTTVTELPYNQEKT